LIGVVQCRALSCNARWAHSRPLIGMESNEGVEKVFPTEHPAVEHLEYQGLDNY
jgi:hypothetical protein